jgi:hypothetical protein
VFANRTAGQLDRSTGVITALASDDFAGPALLYLAIWGEDAEVPVQTAGGKGFRSKLVRWMKRDPSTLCTRTKANLAVSKRAFIMSLAAAESSSVLLLSRDTHSAFTSAWITLFVPAPSQSLKVSSLCGQGSGF